MKRRVVIVAAEQGHREGREELQRKAGELGSHLRPHLSTRSHWATNLLFVLQGVWRLPGPVDKVDKLVLVVLGAFPVHVKDRLAFEGRDGVVEHVAEFMQQRI
eukprot:scaffold1833_cov255-Pinguiococcus_pyrenoidosus.AAC.16